MGVSENEGALNPPLNQELAQGVSNARRHSALRPVGANCFVTVQHRTEEVPATVLGGSGGRSK